MTIAHVPPIAHILAIADDRSGHFQRLPLIDLSPMFGSDELAKQALARELREICINVGFFYLTGHGVPQADIDHIFQVGKAFMQLPEAVKQPLAVDRHPNKYAGYSPLRSRANALHCAYDMTVEFADDAPEVLAGHVRPCRHPWPEDYPEFERAMRAYRATMIALGRRLFGAFALSLNLPEDHFESITHEPFGSLRVNYYPPQNPASRDVDTGIYAHTDYQCFTLLAQDEVPGLQVQNEQGVWVDAPPMPGTFVVNIGDLMARWTNDLFKSTPHRVQNLSGKERLSVPFFFGTDFLAVIDTLPSCISPERPRKYEPVVSGLHVLRRYTAYQHQGANG